MSTPIEKLSEPVRKWVYSSLVAVGAVLVFYGVVTGEELAIWLPVLQTVLVVPFVETARAKVRPVTKGHRNDVQSNGQSSTR